MPRLDEKLKMKLIIKTYILLKGKATTKELCEFLLENFRFKSNISPRILSLVLRSAKNPNDVLSGLKRRAYYSKEKQSNVSEYYFDGEKK